MSTRWQEVIISSKNVNLCLNQLSRKQCTMLDCSDLFFFTSNQRPAILQICPVYLKGVKAQQVPQAQDKRTQTVELVSQPAICKPNRPKRCCQDLPLWIHKRDSAATARYDTSWHLTPHTSKRELCCFLHYEWKDVIKTSHVCLCKIKVHNIQECSMHLLLLPL